MTFSSADVIAVGGQICPTAPGDAQQYTDQLLGYLTWGVLVIFIAAVVVAIGAIAAGRLFSMPHASQVGIISIVVVFLCAIAYMIAPGVIGGLTGSGCINSAPAVVSTSDHAGLI